MRRNPFSLDIKEKKLAKEEGGGKSMSYQVTISVRFYIILQHKTLYASEVETNLFIPQTPCL